MLSVRLGALSSQPWLRNTRDSRLNDTITSQRCCLGRQYGDAWDRELSANSLSCRGRSLFSLTLEKLELLLPPTGLTEAETFFFFFYQHDYLRVFRYILPVLKVM